MRVHELAKQLNISAKDLIAKLSEQGVSVKSHMSALDEDSVQKIKQVYAPGKENLPTDEVVPESMDGDDAVVDLIEKKFVKKTKEKKTKASAVVIEKVDKELSKKAKKEKPGKKIIKESVKEESTPKIEPEKEKSESVVEIGADIQVKELADLMGKPVTKVISVLIELGMMVTLNEKIDKEAASIVAHEFGFEVVEKKEEVKVPEPVIVEEEPVDDKDMVEKAPVVTFMGHVDHGKTSLLDYIRKANVADNEAGKITQHIGAYEVVFNDKKIVFLDTPGHKAFTAMRSRGANVTDIVVLVVAADDGIMEQTREAISHAQAADVPLIVAVNKIDRPNATPDVVLRQLSELNLMPEDWGGEVICVKVSAITGEGIEQLLEMIQLQAEMMELKANPNGLAKGTIIESKLTRGRGPTVTVLMQKGTIRKGDPIICGPYSGKVKCITNDKGKQIKSAGPATPVEILGLDGVPEAGDLLVCVSSDKEAKRLANNREMELRKAALEKATKPTTLEELYERIEADEAKELKLIIKGDVHGSVEALAQTLEEQSTEKVSIHVVHRAVGDISESDVMLASASNAIILGFCIKVDKRARELAKKEGVQIKTYTIIYEALEDVRKSMTGLLDAKLVEQIVGHAEVREIFKVSRIGVIAGCYVKDGKAVKNGKVRLLRDEDQLFEGNIDALKRFKDEVKEVRAGLEFGLKLHNFDDIKIGDIVEFMVYEKVAQTL